MSSILGTRVRRVEDKGFLTRGAVYTEDVQDDRLTDALYLTLVRSPVAHGRITGIDTSAARESDRVVAVFTAADLQDVPPQPPSLPMFPPGMAQPLLAHDVVRYVGEPIAALLTSRVYDGADAAELVSVDFDPLPAVTDPARSARDEILLFPEVGTNTAFDVAAMAAAAAEAQGVQLPAPPADPFQGCEVVIRQVLHNQRVAPAPLEGRAAAATWEDDRLLLWCSSQGAQTLRPSVAAMLGIPPDQVRLITPDVGGAFGGKFFADPEHAICAWASRRLGRPVRWTETRSENLLSMHGRGQIQTITIGGRRDGTIEAYQLDVIQDAGAYPRIGSMLPALTTMMASGVYAIDPVLTSARSVVTNTGPMGAFRGAGRPEATAAIERAVDLFAAEVGMDPAAVRKMNVLAAFTEPITVATGAVYDTGDYQGALERVLEAADYAGLRAEQTRRRERGDVRQLGIGLSCYVEITGAGMEPGVFKENSTVEVHADGTVTVLTGTSPHGQGHATSFAMIVSDRLGVPIDQITLRWGDTDVVPEGAGTGGSRSLQQGGAAVLRAADELVELARIRAAGLLEVDPDDIEVDTDNARLRVAGVPDAGVTFAELAAVEELKAHTVFSAPGPTFPFGAHLAVVEVDTESGQVEVTRLVAVDDAGTILNPLIVEGQIHGGLAAGIAQALYEEIRYDEDGNPQTGTFADYSIVAATEVPSFQLVPMETPTPYNPLGAKGVGEAGTTGATPAVQNAVVDALAHLGVRHIDLPTTSQRVWRAINEARNGVQR
ncbi:xanthine dehydrogenase family protein molybdopterin-binding subunit [Pseudonocardia eucalypti]|uniref:Xanthine dehydrogenase family protein molybdopterin-binding subunit n=1 Tax=Pseudonocardia eucalypti TaxID=648755 RepID=A0ABP9PTN3_9PSEU|nr:carbon-monoxide dehydrogenase large subunit [Pseudonocardia eucalypti]